LTVKTLSGAIGACFVIAVLIFDQTMPMLLNVLIGLVCSLSIYEIFSALHLKNKYLLSIPSYFFAFLLPIIGGYETRWQFFCYIYTLITVGVVLFRNKYLKFKDVLMIYSMTVLIPFSLMTLIRLRDVGGKIGTFYVLIALGIAWLSDTSAYFGGNFLGKQRLCPEISPKKTVEGAVSGSIGCIAIMLLIGLVFENFVAKNTVRINYILYISICAIGSLIAVMGDLFFSWVKRGFKIKDFGDVIPGHGGALDRFDSVIFVAPFVYFMTKIFGILEIV
jgi:phosphatidate cytidylyltransferase